MISLLRTTTVQSDVVYGTSYIFFNSSVDFVDEFIIKYMFNGVRIDKTIVFIWKNAFYVYKNEREFSIFFFFFFNINKSH